MDIETSLHYAVVGAGISGAAFAYRASQLGVQVTVFDKARDVGGRMSTRKRGAEWFDLGSTLIDTHVKSFSKVVEEWRQAGWVTLYTGRIKMVGGKDETLNHAYRVPTQGMSGVVKALIGDVPTHTSVHVYSLHLEIDGWWIKGVPYTQKEEAWGPFDGVICALPGPQAGPILLPHKNQWGLRALRAKYQPQWVICCTFDASVNTPYDIAFLRSHPVLKLISRERSKPNRSADETWMIQAQPRWSIDHLELTKEELAPLLLDAFRYVVGDLPNVTRLEAHKWRYSYPETPSSKGEPFFDPSMRLGVCGDWLSGGGLGQAFESGHTLARMVHETEMSKSED